MGRELRTQPRYFIVTPVAAEIAGVHADVVDLSTHGARLQVTHRPPLGNIVPFSLRSGPVTIATTAVVVWCDVAAFALDDEESDRYFCGVAFVESIHMMRYLIEELVDTKAAVPIEDCRIASRYRVASPLTASFADLPSLRVLDISIRGARVITPELLQPGSSGRLRFSIDGNDTHVWLPASVVWSRPAERKGRFEAGLRIADAEEWLRAVIDELALRDGVLLDTQSLRRKFDPFTVKPGAGLLAIR
jgi:PilZ domain-containing protein